MENDTTFRAYLSRSMTNILAMKNLGGLEGEVDGICRVGTVLEVV